MVSQVKNDAFRLAGALMRGVAESQKSLQVFMSCHNATRQVGLTKRGKASWHKQRGSGSTGFSAWGCSW